MRPVVFDATRLLARAGHATPTGIDRVDLAYAEALLAEPGFATELVVFDRLGPFRFSASAAQALVASTAARWREAGTRETPAFAALLHWLASTPGTPRPLLSSPGDASWMAALPTLAYRLQSFRRGIAADAIYVNTSHGRLFRPELRRWLAPRGRCGVFFVHDLIPIEHPAFNRAGEDLRHARRLRVVAAHARLVLVNSAATRAALLDWLRAERLPLPPVEILPLGVDTRVAPSAPPSSAPYFVILGTIEPRKNHALLLHIWRRLAACGFKPMPRLIVIGRRGWENQTVFNQLERVPALRPWVIEVAGLADAEIGRLLAGACALLAPSLAEGYGLPVAEALAAGTPVVASDLPAHREIAGDAAQYLDPLDGPAWQRAIEQRAAAGLARGPVRPQWAWREHGAEALRLIAAAIDAPP